MKTKRFFFVAAYVAMAFIFFTSCSGGGCVEPNKNGRIIVGGGITYQKCLEAASNNSRCIGSGIWERYSGADVGGCECRGKPCEDKSMPTSP